MFKFLLIVGIIFYLIYKIGTLFFRAGAASQQQNRNFYNPPNSNVNVDPSQAKSKKGSGHKGGEYIDYEEVK